MVLVKVMKDSEQKHSNKALKYKIFVGALGHML